MKFLLFLAFFLQSVTFIAAANDAATTDSGAILVLGDSWASLSGDYMSNICGPQTTRPVQNDAKSGSTADDWASGETAVKSMTNANYDYDYVWLSLGGNDFLDAQCDISVAEQVSEDIITTISHIVDNSSNANIKILYFGYSYPSEDICGNGVTADLFDEQSALIRKAIKNSDYSKYVTVLDISKTFVTMSSSPLSDQKWYADEIHMNELGYLKLFSKLRIQMFFGCNGVVLPIIHAGMEINEWSTEKKVGVAVGVVAALIALCCLCCCSCRRRRRRKAKELEVVSLDGYYNKV